MSAETSPPVVTKKRIEYVLSRHELKQWLNGTLPEGLRKYDKVRITDYWDHRQTGGFVLLAYVEEG